MKKDTNVSVSVPLSFRRGAGGEENTAFHLNNKTA